MNDHLCNFVLIVLLATGSCRGQEPEPTPYAAISSLSRDELIQLYRVADNYRSTPRDLHSTDFPEQFLSLGFVTAVVSGDMMVFFGPFRDLNDSDSCVRLLFMQDLNIGSWRGFELFDENSYDAKRLLTLAEGE